MDNYPVLAGASSNEYIGGESVQQTLLARACVELGLDVSMVVKDPGTTQGELVDGVTVWRAFRPGAGLPGLRFIHPRVTGLLRAMRRADADVYFQSCAGMATGVTAWFCRRQRRRMVFRLAHDSDCVPGEQLIRLARDRKIYEYGLRNADLISAQGVQQSTLR